MEPPTIPPPPETKQPLSINTTNLLPTPSPPNNPQSTSSTSTPTTHHPSTFQSSLSSGFKSLANSSTATPSTSSSPARHNTSGAPLRTSFGLISPTARPKESIASPTDASSHFAKSQPGWANAQNSCLVEFIEPEIEFYPLISTILHRDLKSMIRNVPYQHSRSGANTLIDCLYLRTLTTQTANFWSSLSPFLTAKKKRNLEEGSSSVPPSELHLQPYCYVYIAGCDGIEHYRSKIRPTLQKFVSEMESRNAASGGGGQYLILYHNTATSNLGSGKGRQSVRDLDGSARDTQKEKELLKKFNADFPNKVCVLSRLLLAEASSSVDQFLKQLGLAIIAGFQSRVQRYDEELRRLDAMRRTPQRFDFSSLFLVKESFAFTYEQMGLYREALLHYEELDAFVPDVGLTNTKPKDNTVSSDYVAMEDNDMEVWEHSTTEYAEAGDTEGFRGVVGTGKRKVPSWDVHQYLYMRESHLLFLLGRPVEIIQRANTFVMLGYRMRLGETKAVGAKEAFTQTDAESWALSTCWDVRCACQSFFSFSKHDPKTGTSSSLNLSVVARGVGVAEQEQDASRRLSELLEFARLRLLKLGDLELGSGKNPIRKAAEERPIDTLNTWVQWKDLKDSPPPSILDEDSDVMDNDAKSKHDSMFLSGALQSTRAFISKYLQLATSIISLNQHAGRDRFASRLQGEQAEILMLSGDYPAAVSVLLQIVDYNCVVAKEGWHELHFWRLFRLACCQRFTGDAPSYIRTLSKCFHPQFYTQFKRGGAAPKKAVGLFQTDLEQLVQEESVQNAQLGISPFLETDIMIEPKSNKEPPTAMSFENWGKRSHHLAYLRKKLMKHQYEVGEAMEISVGIVCHLSRPIVVDEVKLFLMTLEEYERLYARGANTNNINVVNKINKETSFRVLTKNAPISLDPGSNECRFDWIPMMVGQFVIASVEIQWGKASFFHDVASLRKPIQGIDVLPAHPTQTFVLNPLFLIPGEKQEIRMKFSSKKDILTKGIVELTCSEGLKVLPPGVEDPNQDDSDAWLDKCSISLDACGLDSNQHIKTLVKSDAIQAHAHGAAPKAVQTLQANVSTSFHHALYKQVTEGDEPESPPMKHTLQARVTTLIRPAITMNQTEAFPLSKGIVMISVSVLCNTPTPFFIKEWNVHFPPPLALVTGAENEEDSNEVLRNHSVVEGQEICFAFTCRRMGSQEKSDASNNTGGNGDLDGKPNLCVILRDDQGKSFRQVLPLDLQSFYEQIHIEDEYSGMNKATAELKCSLEEGIVGAPVHFTYDLDVSLISPSMLSKRSIQEDINTDQQPLLYSIHCDEIYWILGGKVRGTVQTQPQPGNKIGAKVSLDFIGIPTRSGTLKNFPEITLYYAPPSSSEESLSNTSSSPMSITVHCHVPDSFMSLSFKNHMALAAPASLDVSSSY